MERRIKERLTGAAILVMLGVIFIPMVLDDSIHTDTAIEDTNIPERPKGSFDSRSPSREGAGPPRPASKPQAKVELALEPEAEPESPPSVKSEEEAAPAATAVKETEKEEEKTAAVPEQEPAAEEKPQQAEQEETKVAESERVEEVSPEKKAPAREVKSRGLTAWVVQLGSFSKEDNANNLVKKLQGSGYPAFIEPLKQDSGTAYRVRIGPELLRSDANALKEKLEQELEMEGIVLEYP